MSAILEMTEANQIIEEITKTENGLEHLPDLLPILLDLYPKVLAELKVVREGIGGNLGL